MGASTKFPTVTALVMARVMKRVAAKYADLGLAREANSLEKEALSALKNGQSALSDPRQMNSGGNGLTAPALGPKSLEHRVRLPSPCEQDSIFADILLNMEKLLAEKRAKEKAAKED
jgi:hypothetical protein